MVRLNNGSIIRGTPTLMYSIWRSCECISHLIMKFIKSLTFLQEKQHELLKVHYPVMYREVLKLVQKHCKEERQYNLVDCTVGTGAHAKILLDNLPRVNMYSANISSD